MSSSSYILFDLISPEMILQNRQSIISVFVLVLLSFFGNFFLKEYLRMDIYYHETNRHYG